MAVGFYFPWERKLGLNGDIVLEGSWPGLSGKECCSYLPKGMGILPRAVMVLSERRIVGFYSSVRNSCGDGSLTSLGKGC